MLRTNELESANQLEAKERLAKALEGKCTEFEGNYLLLQKEHADLVTQNDELQIKVKQIEEVAITNKELVNEFREKNEFLTSLLSKYKKFEDMVNKLNDELETERQQTREMIDALQESKKESDNLKNKVMEMEARFRNESEQEHLKHHLEIDRVTLEIKAEYQQKHEQAVNEYQKNTARLQEEHNCRIQALLDKISEIQNSRNSQKGPRQSNAATE